MVAEKKTNLYLLGMFLIMTVVLESLPLVSTMESSPLMRKRVSNFFACLVPFHDFALFCWCFVAVKDWLFWLFFELFLGGPWSVTFSTIPSPTAPPNDKHPDEAASFEASLGFPLPGLPDGFFPAEEWVSDRNERGEIFGDEQPEENLRSNGGDGGEA